VDPNGFAAFFAETEPRLRRAFVAAYGPERGREAAAEALAYAWQHRPTAFLDRSGVVAMCPIESQHDLEPCQGIWLSTAEPPGNDFGTRLATGAIGGTTVDVVQVSDPARQVPDPALDLIVRAGSSTVWISIGVGQDASVARAILRSIHRV
jgi:hypothetical protein